VIGGCLDDEFRVPSSALLQMAQGGKVTLLVSDILIEEVEKAPPAVRDLLSSLPAESL
jgi:hypothetical protein